MSEEAPDGPLEPCEAGFWTACPCNGYMGAGSRGMVLRVPAAQPWVPPSKRPDVRLDTQADDL